MAYPATCRHAEPGLGLLKLSPCHTRVAFTVPCLGPAPSQAGQQQEEHQTQQRQTQCAIVMDIETGESMQEQTGCMEPCTMFSCASLPSTNPLPPAAYYVPFF